MLRRYRQTKSSSRVGVLTTTKYRKPSRDGRVKSIEIWVPPLPKDHKEYGFGDSTCYQNQSLNRAEGRIVRDRQKRIWQSRCTKSSSSNNRRTSAASTISDRRLAVVQPLSLPEIPPDPAIVTPRKRSRKALGHSPISPSEIFIVHEPTRLIFKASHTDALAEAVLRPFLKSQQDVQPHRKYSDNILDNVNDDLWSNSPDDVESTSFGTLQSTNSSLSESFAGSSTSKYDSDLDYKNLNDNDDLPAYQHPFADYHQQQKSTTPSTGCSQTSTSPSTSTFDTAYYDQYALSGLHSSSKPPSSLVSPTSPLPELSPHPQLNLPHTQLLQNHLAYDRLQSLTHPPAHSYPINPSFNSTISCSQPHLPPHAIPEHPVFIYFGHDLSGRPYENDNSQIKEGDPPLPKLINDQVLFTRNKSGDQTDYGFGPGVHVHEKLRLEVGRAEDAMLRYIMSREFGCDTKMER